MIGAAVVFSFFWFSQHTRSLSLYDMMARTKVGWQNSLPSLMELWMRAVMDLILLCDGTKVFSVQGEFIEKRQELTMNLTLSSLTDRTLDDPST